MPVRDRTSPMGAGPRTGRGMGYCSRYAQPEFSYPAGRFRGRSSDCWAGMGRGWRHMFYLTGLPGWARPGAAPVTPEQEMAWLKNEADWLKNQLEVLNRRMEELETQGS